MANANKLKEVRYDKYCKTCKHRDKDEKMVPCCYCMDETVMLESAKPARYEQKGN